MSLKLATYNIHRAVGSDGRMDPDRIARVVLELDADVVALQEVGFGSEVPGALLAALGETMNAQVIEGTTLRDERGHYGNAVLTRISPTQTRHIDLSVPRREPRGAIELDIEVANSSVQILATHLGLRPAERRQQILRLLDGLQDSSAAVRVLCGDLNEWFLWGRPVRWLHRVFDRTPAPATFPARRPRLALDRLWVAPFGALERVYVHDSDVARIASDHLPLVGELRF